MKARKIAAYVVLCLIWGSTWFAIHVLVNAVPPLRGASWRFAVAVVALTPVLLWRRRVRLPSGRTIRVMALLSVTMIALPYALIFWAETRVASGTVAVLFAVLPLVAGVYANRLEGGRMPSSAMQALVLGVGGIALVVSSALSVSLEQGLSLIAVMVGVVSAGISSVHAKRELANVDPMMSAVLQLGGGAIVLGLMSLAMERGQPSHWTAGAVGALLFLGVGASAISFPLYYWLLQEIEAYQVGTIQWFEPLVAVGEGAVLLGETLTWRMLTGAAIVLASLVRVMSAQRGDDDSLSLLPPEEITTRITREITRDPEGD